MDQAKLYTIQNLEIADGQITATLSLDASHPVFQGHFPGQPILPGACMLDLVKEITSLALKIPLRLVKADNLKFISPVDPLQADQIHISINYRQTENELKIKATINADTPCMKMDGTFKIG